LLIGDLLSMAETVLDLIRHGQPEGGSRFRGNGCDDPLSELGWSQMWRSVSEPCPWQRVVSSPMRRCRAFAEALADRYDLAVTLEERFKEVGFGSWEGQTRQQLLARNAEAYHAFYRDPVHSRPPGAEPLGDFHARVSAALEETARSAAGTHCLIVAHAGVIRAAVGHVLEAPAARWYRLRVDHAGITRLRFGRYGATLDFHNARGL
jgi:alpha-ribazole phosphatase